jgi:excisionase family DNA binding protein
MRAAEVAKLLGVSERRVYQMMDEGLLDYRGRRPKRISRESFGRYLEGRWPQLLAFISGDPYGNNFTA